MTENGCAVPDDDVNAAKKDDFRVEFYQGLQTSWLGLIIHLQLIMSLNNVESFHEPWSNYFD